MNCGTNSILISSVKGDRGATGATGATGPVGPAGIGVAYSIKKLFINWIYPSNGSTNSGSLISISDTDFTNAMFSTKAYNKGTSVVDTISYFSSPIGMMLTKIDIYVYDSINSKFYNVSTFFRPSEIEYSQASISIYLDNAVTRVAQQLLLGTPMKFLVSIMG